MNKYSILLATIVICLMSTYSSMAATAEVEWSNPDKYRDIHSGEQGRKHFRKRIFASLDKHFTKLASALPEGQILKIKVTNLDLAGDVNFGAMRQIRVIRDIDYPRMEFSYVLLNADQSIIKSGDANLKDMNFRISSKLAYRNQTLGYEKIMLDEWFNKNIK